MKTQKFLHGCTLALLLTSQGIVPALGGEGGTGAEARVTAETSPSLSFRETLIGHNAVDVFQVDCDSAHSICATAADLGGCRGGDDDLAISVVGLSSSSAYGQGEYADSSKGCSATACVERSSNGSMRAFVSIALSDSPDDRAEYAATLACVNSSGTLTASRVTIRTDQ